KQQVDVAGLFEGCKADGRAVHGGDKGQARAEARLELLLVVGGTGPGIDLALRIVVRREPFDARAEDIGEDTRVVRKIRAQGEGGIGDGVHGATLFFPSPLVGEARPRKLFSSCPGLTRASIPTCGKCGAALWIAGSSPAMTSLKVIARPPRW